MTRSTRVVTNSALVGFAAGCLAAATYVLAGGDVWLRIPGWASVLFYPGFVAGGLVYGLVTEEYFVVLAGGCVAVGIEYAAIAAITARLFALAAGARVRRTRQASITLPASSVRPRRPLKTDMGRSPTAWQPVRIRAKEVVACTRR